MKLVPLGQNVVVRQSEAEETTSGGIVLPDSAKEKPRQGRVLSIGDGRLMPDGSRTPPQISEGDRVLFGSYAGTKVEVDGQELLIIPEDQVLAVIHGSIA